MQFRKAVGAEFRGGRELIFLLRLVHLRVKVYVLRNLAQLRRGARPLMRWPCAGGIQVRGRSDVTGAMGGLAGVGTWAGMTQSRAGQTDSKAALAKSR